MGDLAWAAPRAPEGEASRTSLFGDLLIWLFDCSANFAPALRPLRLKI